MGRQKHLISFHRRWISVFQWIKWICVISAGIQRGCTGTVSCRKNMGRFRSKMTPGRIPVLCFPQSAANTNDSGIWHLPDWGKPGIAVERKPMIKWKNRKDRYLRLKMENMKFMTSKVRRYISHFERIKKQCLIRNFMPKNLRGMDWMESSGDCC